jgi:O-antigen ligase
MNLPTVALPRRDALPHPPDTAYPATGLLAAVAFAIAALYAHPAMFAVAAVLAIGAGIALYEPRVIGPMLALALPLEISKLAFPFLTTRSELGGGLGPTSVIDAGRLVVAIAVLVWLVRPGRPRADVLPTSILTLPLALLFAVYALSTLYAVDASAARTESLRLLFSLGMFALVPFFVRDRTSLRWTLYAIVFAMAALSIVGIYEEAAGKFLWNEGLGLYGERRINATFADPNHFARFLLEGIVVAPVLWFFVGRRAKFAFILPAMLLGILTLEFTGSRGSWLVGVVTLPLAVAALPVARSLRLRMLGMGLALLVLAALALAAFNPYFSKRVDTFKFGFDAAGARPYLVEAGLNMFRDHPLAGVGAGSYQASFEQDYYSYKDPKIKANVTMSHTSAVTIMAELGAIGIVAVAFVAARWGMFVRSASGRTEGELRAVLAGVAVISMIIFLGSQTEGRFLEDPFLWLATGLAVAVDAIVRAEQRASLSAVAVERLDEP